MALSFSTETTPPAPGPDGLVRLGLVALSTDLTIENDLAGMLPGHARLHVARVAYANPTTPENLAAMGPHLAAAADLLVPDVPLAAIGFGCTTGAVVIGDATVGAAIDSVRPGVPVFTPAQSACRAFRAMGLSRIAVLTPYLPGTTRVLAEYFDAAGLRLCAVHGLGMADDRDIARLSEDTIIAAVEAADHPEAEAMFISCTATPVVRLIDRIEDRIGKPVVSSNQALGRAMLDAAGLAGHGPGRLFTLPAGATCR